MIPLLALGVVLLAGWAFYSPLKVHYQESREQARLEAELASLQERNETLNAQVERLKTPEGVEELARESLGMVKEGENLYVIVDPDIDATSTAAGVADTPEIPGSLWNDLLDLVFGVR
ncbi:MAG: septum formation initiator family protein [Anaerosomatales bacterium]|nr:septum formation initiator family protein [Anaerosomatales bacterium]MDT8434137.1 septum formation initiator family protein [Anaerosomatales bacterium]